MLFRDLWILFLIPIAFTLLLLRVRVQKPDGFIFSSDSIIKKLRGNTRVFLSGKTYFMKIIALCFLILAMARPVLLGDTKVKKEGIAMVIAFDCSSTMLARDLSFNLSDLVFVKGKTKDHKMIDRLEASVIVAQDFTRKRSDDLIGVVAFASSAFVVCPLTFDHEWVHSSMKRLKVGLIRDGTAIGSGILSGLNSLKDVKAKSRIIILLTDGVNNYGQISPLTAAKAARALGVRIYTIGIAGGGSVVSLPVKDQLGREEQKKVLIALDEEELRKISDITGGEYFRVDSIAVLRKSYEKIDKLERTEIAEKGYERYQDIYMVFLYGAILMLLMEMILSNTIFRKIP